MRRKPMPTSTDKAVQTVDVQTLMTFVRGEPGVTSITLEPVTKKLPLQIGAEITFRLVKITREVIEE